MTTSVPCAFCGVVATPLVCSGCRTAAYCSKRCQRTGWKAHRLECPLLVTRLHRSRSIKTHNPAPRGTGEFLDGSAASTDAFAAKRIESVRPKEDHHAPGPYGIIDCAGMGRGAAAIQQLKCGDLVLTEAAIASVPQQQYQSAVCHRCYCQLGASTQHLQCTDCASSVWCSVACKTEAKGSHRIECAVLQQFEPRVREKLHGLRFFMQLATLPSPTAVVSPAGFASSKTPELLDGLVSSVDRVTPKALGISRDRIRECIVAVEANGFFIADLDGRRLGSGYYPSAALFNHSCAPNAIVHFEKGRIEIRALRHIAPGEELRISYTELYRPVVARREALLTKKNFLCRCVRCDAEAGAGISSHLEGFSCPTKGCPGYAVHVNADVKCLLCEGLLGTSADVLKQCEAVSAMRMKAGDLLSAGKYHECVVAVENGLKLSNGLLDALHHERFELAVLAVDAFSLLRQTSGKDLPFALAAIAAMRPVYGYATFNPRALRMLQHIVGIYYTLAEESTSEAVCLMRRQQAKAALTSAVQVATTICGSQSTSAQALTLRLAEE